MWRVCKAKERTSRKNNNKSYQTEFCYMSFATQSQGPFEIDCVYQPPNSNYQESTSDNQQTDTADQQEEYELSDNELDDNNHENSSESDTNETNRVIGISKPISRWYSFEISTGSKDSQSFSIIKTLL